MNLAAVKVQWEATVTWRAWFEAWTKVHESSPNEPCLERCPCCVHTFTPKPGEGSR